LYIKNIGLRNFKNYEDSFFSFKPEGCIIIGKNGIGKTNLLEAMSYFTYGRSILNHHDEQLISFAKDSFVIKSSFYVNEDTAEFQAFFSKQKKKVIQIENKPLKKISDLYRHVQTVYSSTDDIFNIFSTPSKRRHFVDIAIAKIYPSYIDFLRRYKNTLAQRNSLLKTNFNPKEKEAWDKTFCEEAKSIVEYRIKFFDQYNEFVKKSYGLITGEEEIDILLKLNYYQEHDFVPKMISLLNKNLVHEKKYQTSLYGPHRDDFDITISQKNALHFASQGQKRSIVIALKIALANIITSINNIHPILIFDDTLAELDKSRSSSLLSKLNPNHQVFIASPTLDRYLSIGLPVLDLEAR